MKSSTLYRQFQKQIHNKNIRVVSFDIFETLAFRKVNKPIDIFYLVGKHKYVQKIYEKAETFQRFRIEAEKRARIHNVHLEEITLELIYKEFPLSNKQRKKIQEIELQEEQKNLYINKEILKWITRANKYGKKIVLISDMYLSKQQLQKLILAKLPNKKLISKLYVSNNYNATKTTGNLYPIVLKDLNIAARELLHVGDNQYADIEMAHAKGIQSLHYACDTYIQEMSEIESNYIKYHSCNNNYRLQAALLNPFKTNTERFFFNLGAAIFGPVLWEFAHWVNTLAQQNNITQINCVMREGRIFSKYITKINKKLDVNRIYASRKSTFLPSIDIKNLQKNGFDFYKYRKFTIRNFYDLFQLKITNKQIKKYQDELLINANTILYKNSNLLETISLDFQNRLHTIKHNIHKEKKLFQQYLDQLTYNSNSILIDFGGTGTILQNIANALDDACTPKINVLFYMHASGFDKMLTHKTFPFLPYSQHTMQKIEKLRRSPEFIEILFNGDAQTTLCYQEKNGVVKPVQDLPHSKIATTQKIARAFDKGIDSFFKIGSSYNLSKKLYSPELILDFITRLIDVPHTTEAKFIGKLYHDEGYGSSIVEQLITPTHLQTIQTLGVASSYLKNAADSAFQIGNIPWVQGCLTTLQNDLIINANGLKTKSINENSIAKITEILLENPDIEKVFIYGAGQFFKELSPTLTQLGITIEGVLDTSAKMQPYTFNGFQVTSLENAQIQSGVTIIVSSAVFALDITQTIIEFTIKNKLKLNIINFYNGLLRQ